jgi:hypothetical protein
MLVEPEMRIVVGAASADGAAWQLAHARARYTSRTDRIA